jgi:hypothetical protein
LNLVLDVLAQKKILDKLAALEIRAEMLSALDQNDEAAKVYRCTCTAPVMSWLTCCCITQDTLAHMPALQMDAVYVCRELLAVNPDNYRHHAALRRAEGMPDDPTADLSAEQQGRMRELYKQLQADHPRSSACFRIPLDFEV